MREEAFHGNITTNFCQKEPRNARTKQALNNSYMNKSVFVLGGREERDYSDCCRLMAA